MLRRRLLGAVLIFLSLAQYVRAQAPVLPDEKVPLLRLDTGGPTSEVTALALSPDGKTLYAAGWDKVVRVWNWDPRAGKAGEFVAQRTSFRVPIGPGLQGAINAMALSADGRWLAVGGLGVFRGQAGFRLPGLVLPAKVKTPDMRADEGTIFVFATARPGKATQLHGHRGPVLALAFARQEAEGKPLLVSAGRDWIEERQRYTGAARVWDLDKEKAIAELSDLPDPVSGLPPGLAARRTGARPTQVQVALAWDEGTIEKGGKLRFWDVEQKRVVDSAEQEGAYNNTVAFLPRQEKLLTGSVKRADGDGQVRIWDLAPGDAPSVAGTLVAFPHGDKTYFVPRALALVAAGADGKLDHAAIVLHRVPEQEYRLLLAPLGAAQAYGAKDSIRLWSGRGRVPTLATSPGGSHLAVAGAPDHAIRVYKVADLLKGEAQPQVLRSIGTRIGYAAFVYKGEGKARRAGLLLSEKAKTTPGAEPRAAEDGDMVFDFVNRRLTSDLTGWGLDSPAPDGWKHTRGGPDPKSAAARVLVRAPGGTTVTIRLFPGLAITDHALLPPRAPLNLPLLAVASVKGKEPLLLLYNAASGDLLCQCSGHLNRISALAFSADGRFLVSAAADQTVCLWSLVGLEKFVGKQGQLRDVIVQKEEGKGLVITAVGPDSPANGLLKTGQKVAGLVIDAKLKPLTSPLDFYDAMLTQVPGKNATLRLKDDGDVQVPVSQATQQRTPLLVLFVTNGTDAKSREWLGWNPVGPYDSSTPQMASTLGWHFNTGKPGEPVQFTPADKDRPQERREGLLKHLVARGRLAPALEDWDKENEAKPKPPPKMTLGIDDMDRQFVRVPGSMLRMHVTEFLVKDIVSAEWRVDDAPFRSFTKMTGEEQVADYEQAIQWLRGPHRIQVRLQTGEKVPQEFTRELLVSYVPRPPEVVPRGIAALVQTGKIVTVEREDFPLEAIVRPGVPGEKLRVQLYHQQEILDVILSPEGEIRRTIKLRSGNNRIELIAVHKDAAAGTEGAETGRVVLNVTYKTKPPEVVPPPLIALEIVIPMLGGVEPGGPLPIRPGQPVVVTVPQVRLKGTIMAVRKLARAERTDGGEGEGEKFADLARFVSQSSSQFVIDETLRLKPGSRKVVLRARTDTSKVAEQIVTLEYRPALPHPELTADPVGPIFLDDGRGPPEVRLGGRIVAARDPAPPEVKVLAALLHNGKEIPAVIDPNGQTWSARVRLEPTNNRFQVKVRHQWQEAITGNLELKYLRPPRNVRGSVPPTTKAPTLEFTAQVDSPLPLTADSVRIFRNGRELGKPRVTGPSPAAPTWDLRVQVPLEPGRNDLRIEVVNAEGRTSAPGTWSITYEPIKVPPARPLVTFVEPRVTLAVADPSFQVSRPDLTVKFQVTSKAPLRHVVLTARPEGWAAERKVFAADAKDTGSGFEMTASADLHLAPGLTFLNIEAENEGGTGQAPALVINYVPPPPRLVLEALESNVGKQQRFKITETDGKCTCQPVTQARLVLYGKVVWERAENQLARTQYASVYVNGSHQWRGELEPAQPGTLERTFQAEIVLNRSEANQIEVVLPKIQLADHAVRWLWADCRLPVLEQRLHVQVINPEETDEKRLIDQILETLQGSEYQPAKQEFTRPGFASSYLYPPMTEDVNEDRVIHRLVKIKRGMDKRWPNDVVLVYYFGGEAVDAAGRLVSLTRGRPPQPLITRERLEREFADMLGVKVLLLDVARPKPGAALPIEVIRRDVSSWLDTPERFVWMRATWLAKGAMPVEARLLQVLRESLPKAQRLGEVPIFLDQRFSLLRVRYGTLRADWYLPPALNGLIINRPPGGK